jgi:hypothetical protein
VLEEELVSNLFYSRKGAAANIWQCDDALKARVNSVARLDSIVAAAVRDGGSKARRRSRRPPRGCSCSSTVHALQTFQEPFAMAGGIHFGETVAPQVPLEPVSDGGARAAHAQGAARAAALRALVQHAPR